MYSVSILYDLYAYTLSLYSSKESLYSIEGSYYELRLGPAALYSDLHVCTVNTIKIGIYCGLKVI